MAYLGLGGGTPCSSKAWVYRPPAPATRSRQTRGTGRRLYCRANSQAVLILPGFLTSSRQYEDLAALLTDKGYAADIVPLTVKEDWLPVLWGSNFKFYLDKTSTALQRLYSQHGPVALVGHSAGGWVARILLGDQPYEGVVYGPEGRAQVHTLVTLGSPHQSTEQYPFGRVKEQLSGPNLEGVPPEVRGSSLRFANWFYPTAASHPGVRVVCFAGDAIRGQPLLGGSLRQTRLTGDSSGSSQSLGGVSGDDYDGSYIESGAGSMRSVGSMSRGGIGYEVLPQVLRGDSIGTLLSPELPSRLDAWFALESYKSGCGRGEVDGDGVTPVEIAHLPGADNFVVPGVWHSPRRAKSQLWYGDREVLEACWEQYLRQPF